MPERRYRSESQLGDYVGNDPLTPNFALRIFSKGGAAGAGYQPACARACIRQKDVFVAESVAAEIDFTRDASGKVVSLTLKQRGQIRQGERQ